MFLHDFKINVNSFNIFHMRITLYDGNRLIVLLFGFNGICTLMHTNYLTKQIKR